MSRARIYGTLKNEILARVAVAIAGEPFDPELSAGDVAHYCFGDVRDTFEDFAFDAGHLLVLLREKSELFSQPGTGPDIATALRDATFALIKEELKPQLIELAAKRGWAKTEPPPLAAEAPDIPEPDQFVGFQPRG